MNSGIYKIVNSVNNKLYIGSSSNTKRRWMSNHLPQLRNKKHHSIKLQNAFNKYGEQSFTFQVIEECMVEDLVKREQYWIDTLKPHYNVRLDASSNKGVVRTEEHKRRISLKLKGRKRSNEAIAKQKVSSKGYKKTSEHLDKIRQANKGRKKTPVQVEANRQGQLKRFSKSEEILKRSLKQKEVYSKMTEKEKDLRRAKISQTQKSKYVYPK